MYEKDQFQSKAALPSDVRFNCVELAGVYREKEGRKSEKKWQKMSILFFSQEGQARANGDGYIKKKQAGTN
jgi:hypothetical protein